jgi:hypothetical protein
LRVLLFAGGVLVVFGILLASGEPARVSARLARFTGLAI